jgi:uncharacterized membrane protein YkvA (DUF1232 family)
MLDLLQQHLAKCFAAFQETGCDLNSFKAFLRSKQATEPAIDCVPDNVFKLILSIPVMLRELGQLIYTPNLTLEMRALAGGIYSYVFNPFDYINEEVVGFLGFIDDALIVFYGMKLIESIDNKIQFTTIRNKDLESAVEECEKLLIEDLVLALKSYPQQISGILSTANLKTNTMSDLSSSSETLVP